MSPRTISALILATVTLTLPALAGSVDIHTRVVKLQHADVASAVHFLHWDDINELPQGVIDIEVDPKHQEVKIEGTSIGVQSAAQALSMVDIAPKQVRLSVVVVEVSTPLHAAKSRMPSAASVLKSAVHTTPTLAVTVDNNDEATIRMREIKPAEGVVYLDSGLHVAPRVNDNGSITLHGALDLDALMSGLQLAPTSPDSSGMVALVRTARAGRPVVIGVFSGKAAGEMGAKPRYVYVIVTPSVAG